MEKFNSPEYKRSRKFYIIQCAVEYFVALLVADAFLAKLLTSIGISDALTGIISSFIALVGVFQIFTIFIAKIKLSSKKIVLLFDVTSIFFFMFAFLTPFLPVSKTVKTVFVMACIFLAYVFYYLCFSLYFKWANSYVEPTKRADFTATKEMISLFSGMIFTAIIGYVIDRFEGLDNLNGAFLFIAASIFILNICNIICLSMIKKEDKSEHIADSEPIKVVLKNTLGNKNFQHILILTILWNVANYFTIGFMGVFKTNDLLISVFVIQLINIISHFARMLVSKPIAKYSDKKSFAKGFKLGLYLAAIAFFSNIFTTNSTWYLIIPFTVIHSCALAGVGANTFNIVYSYVDSKYVSHAMGLKNGIAGFIGFLASLAGGKIVEVVQANNNTVFGVHIYAQQILCAISLIITIVPIIYTKTVIEKQKVMIQ